MHEMSQTGDDSIFLYHVSEDLGCIGVGGEISRNAVAYIGGVPLGTLYLHPSVHCITEDGLDQLYQYVHH